MVQGESPRSPSAEPAGAQYAMTSPAGPSQPVEVEPPVPTGSQEGSYRFRPCDWLDAHREINPHAPGPDHEVPAPDVAAALTVIGRLVASRRDELTRNLDMSQAELCVAYAPKSKLAGVWFRHSDLRGAILDGADLTGAGLVSADLTGAHLPEAKLVNSNLKDATLNKADLCGAKLSGADLQGAKLEDTNLSGADLRAAKNLTEKQLAQACGSDKTLLPHGWGIENCAKKAGSEWNKIPTSIC